MIDKFTNKFQQAFADAQTLAIERDHTVIEDIHLLKSLLDQQGSSIRSILAQSNVSLVKLRTLFDESLDNLAKLSQSTGEISISPELSKLINLDLFLHLNYLKKKKTLMYQVKCFY